MGMKDLVVDAVEHGTTAVQKVHEAIASRPFAVLEVTPIRLPAKGVRFIHDTITMTVYASIRAVNRIAGAAARAVIEEIERDLPADAGSARGTSTSAAEPPQPPQPPQPR
jgi:hypothetical protein